jgi:hypothetical protein
MVNSHECEIKQAMNTRNTELVRTAMNPVLGLRLSLTTRVMSSRVFHFGRIQREGLDSWGEWLLSINCPWRLDGPSRIVTGSADLWQAADPSIKAVPEDWDYNTELSLQDERVAEALGAAPGPRGEAVNLTDHLTVKSIEAGAGGDLFLTFSGNLRLAVFPAGARGTQWRFFAPGAGKPHLVVSGGQATYE